MNNINKRVSMNIMAGLTRLIDAFLEKSRSVLTINLFKYIESIFVSVAGFSSAVAAVLGFLIIAVLAIRADKLSLFFMAPIWIVLVVLMYYIGEKLIKSCLKAIKNNPSAVGSRDLLDVFAALAAIGAVGSLLGASYMAIKDSSLGIFFSGFGLSVILVYAFWILLNPAILSTEMKAHASAGDEAIAYMALFNKVYLRAAKILFGMLPLLGSLVLLGTFGKVFGDNFYGLMAGGIMGATGFMMVIAGLLAPLMCYLLFIFSYLWLDILRSILSIPAEKSAPANADDEDLDALEDIPEQTKTVLKMVALGVGALLVLVVVAIQGKALYNKLDQKWASHKIEKAREEREIAAKLEEEKQRLALEAEEAARVKEEQAQERERQAQEQQKIQTLVAAARKHLNKDALDLVLEPEVNRVYQEEFGGRLKDFESFFSQSVSKVKESDGAIVAEGCLKDACEDYRAIAAVDVKTGKVTAAMYLQGRVQYSGVEEAQASPALKKWAMQQAQR
jgi:hypothetical protein